MILSLVSATLSLPSLAILSITTQSAPVVAATVSPDLEATTKDVEALRNLLTKAIQSALPAAPMKVAGGDSAKKRIAKRSVVSDDVSEAADPDESSESNVAPSFPKSGRVSIDGSQYGWLTHTYTQADRTKTSFTRGFYCPGVGVWIDTTVSLPVTFDSVKEGAKVEGATDEDDEWSRALGEASGGGTSIPRLSIYSDAVLSSQLDPASREKVLSVATDILIRYGKRVRNLNDDESIVIALKLEGDSISSYYGQFRIVEDDDVTVDATGNTVLKPGLVRNSTATIAPPATETVILRVKRAHLAAHAAGELDDATLEKRIQITKY